MSGVGKARRISIDDFRHVPLDEVSSTNTEALARARAGDSGFLWITARRQTGGRGRRGREWVSERGNLYSSLLLVDFAPTEELGSLPLAVALAVHDTVVSVMPPGGKTVDIKWPNDVLIDRRKTSGILLEAERLPDGRMALVIGIGINILARPDLAQYPVTSLADQGVSISPEELFARLFVNMADALSLWDQGRGIGEIVAHWRRVACGIGEKITVNLPDRSISGIFSGIDDKGLLLLDSAAGTLSIAAGDVFFG
ncbi:biotin biosynthesis protein [Rhizobium sp. Root274]|uniref:biotin--[acetyl-CoA-carboxylase] ligase n=1 Tax=unclassified Rhizobium TaxID=2613769 RepID=UPI0007130290|nr:MULTISPECIES: biotin--[acetyl-CoA-carboxylase] ligase [unclassified Rhizobium]KQW30868.1 biotin biosynthesis protein [Rhizobium sp. Root1240]KRD32413.1 biotin biosynthesis protein [Rhizobium sp. Root274]